MSLLCSGRADRRGGRGAAIGQPDDDGDAGRTRPRMTEAFGLYALSGKATAFIAPLLIAVATAVSGSQQAGHRAADRAVSDRPRSAILGETRWRPRHGMMRILFPDRGPVPCRRQPRPSSWRTACSARWTAPSAQPPDADRQLCARAARRGWWSCPRRGQPGRRCGCSRNRNWGQPEMIEFLQRAERGRADRSAGPGSTSATSASRAAGR